MNTILLGIMSLILCYYLFKGVYTEGIPNQSFEKKGKGRLCKKDLKISSREECVKAAKQLNLPWSKWWVGQDPNIPPGCSWTNKLSMVGKPMAFWNKSEQGSSRYDLNPLCQTPPKQNYNYIDYLNKIRHNLKTNVPDEEGEIPIALRVIVGNNNEIEHLKKKPKDNQDLQGEGFTNPDDYKLEARRSLLTDLARLRQNNETPVSVNLMLSKQKEYN